MIILILLEKEKSCAITGHRPEKFSFQTEGTNPLFLRMMEWIRKSLYSANRTRSDNLLLWGGFWGCRIKPLS